IGTHLDHARWLASVNDTNDSAENSTTTRDVTLGVVAMHELDAIVSADWGLVWTVFMTRSQGGLKIKSEAGSCVG
ncbi:hypothetical protein, partial [Microbacterium sp. NPDC077184]|uniref:hypothetical protein n=1 Tax=Microbacterium sp. NPDC077184 TaxID=3154764 RepID=UPI003418734F